LRVPAVADQAVCIRVWDWSETSQTVTLFARAQGLIRGLAKGSKREKSAFSGGFEPLTRGEIVAIAKPSADLATLTAWDLQEIFPALRRSLSSFFSGMYLADLVQHALHERDPHPVLFDRLLDALRMLGEPEADRRAVLLFQWATLVEAGYRPELDQDVAGGGALGESRTYGFSPHLGGFVPDGAESTVGRPISGPIWRVRAETLELLRGLGANNPPAGPPEAIDRASRLLAAHLREVLGRELPSLRWLFGEFRP
jgi:DNA repair protein RecO (recombination protein O)